MKNKSPFILILLLILSLAGCATAPTGSTPSPVQAALLTDAAFIGTVYELQTQPASRPALLAVQGVLQSVSTGATGATGATIAGILQSAGQTNVLATVAVVTFVSLADTWLQSSSTNQTQLKWAAGCLATGMAQGLGTLPQTPAETKRRSR
jgi:hypothetical protein